jgi:hypothetical protein
MVVRRREGRWIGEQDAHGLVRYAVAMLVRTWNLFRGNAYPPARGGSCCQSARAPSRGFTTGCTSMETADGSIASSSSRASGR